MPEPEPLLLVENHPEWFFRTGKFDVSEIPSLDNPIGRTIAFIPS